MTGPVPAGRLIVTADDFGLSREVNEAVELAHRKGILSAASLMVAGPAAEDAVRRARAMPNLSVGLHLVLVEGRPALPVSQVPRLIDADSRLRTDMGRLGLAIAIDPRVRRQLAAEIEAQFDAFRRTGLPLDHVNAHKHYHVHPMITGMVLAIARRSGPAGMRVPREPARLLRRIEPVGVSLEAALMAPWAASLGRRARAAGFATADRVFGLRWSGAITEARLAGLLRNLPPGTSEVYTHPAVSDIFQGSAKGYRYGDELRALLSPECAGALEEAGTTVGGYGRQLAARHGGAAGTGRRNRLERRERSPAPG